MNPDSRAAPAAPAGPADLQPWLDHADPADAVAALYRQVGLGEVDSVQWSSLSGQVLICLVPRIPWVRGPGIQTEQEAVIIVGDRLYHIPWFHSALSGAW